MIVHGVAELDDDTRPPKAVDMEFIFSLLKATGATACIKTAFRIGKNDNGKKRPLKVITVSETDKNNIMESLFNLKGLEVYKGISITDDYTINERDQIRSFASKAKEMNEKEPNDSQYEWKVRGKPKNGLRIKKFKKRKLQQ